MDTETLRSLVALTFSLQPRDPRHTAAVALVHGLAWSELVRRLGKGAFG